MNKSMTKRKPVLLQNSMRSNSLVSLLIHTPLSSMRHKESKLFYISKRRRLSQQKIVHGNSLNAISINKSRCLHTNISSKIEGLTALATLIVNKETLNKKCDKHNFLKGKELNKNDPREEVNKVKHRQPN